METSNKFGLGKEKLFERIKDKKIRYFSQNRFSDTSGENNLPFEPVFDLYGRWSGVNDQEELLNVSAVATQFVYDLYCYLEAKGWSIPVAFINSSIGGSNIEAWLPRDLIENDKTICYYVKLMDRYPDADSWNKKGNVNYTQTTGLFNDKIAPLKGIKCRGILWYQGESNMGGRREQEFYTYAISRLRETWAEIFSQYGRGKFPIFISGLHSYLYSQYECHLGYLNEAFVNALKADPGNYAVIPNYDLSYAWDIYENHPIHPLDKYPVGERMAKAAIGLLYEDKAPKSAPYYSDYRIEGNKIIIVVSEAPNGLLTKGSDKVKGFYICGKDNVYIQADADIIGKNSIAVWSEFISEPANVAYVYAPMDNTGNVYNAEMLPLCQFATDKTGVIEISNKPYCDMSIQSIWVQAEVTDVFYNSFYHPVWKACTENTGFCSDMAFCRSGCSLRIFGDTNLGVKVEGYPGYEHDLWRFKTLQADIFNIGNGKTALEVVYNDKTIVIDGFREKVYNEGIRGWELYKFDLSGLNRDYIKEIRFLFDLKQFRYNTVNIDNIRVY